MVRVNVPLDPEYRGCYTSYANTLIGTGKYMRYSKYHDKNVDNFMFVDNGILISIQLREVNSSRSGRWENYDDNIMKTDVTELQI